MKRHHGIWRGLWQERLEGNWECICLKYIVYSMRLGQSGVHMFKIHCIQYEIRAVGVHMFKIHCVQCETFKEGTEKGGERRCCLLALLELLF